MKLSDIFNIYMIRKVPFIDVIPGYIRKSFKLIYLFLMWWSKYIIKEHDRNVPPINLIGEISDTPFTFHLSGDLITKALEKYACLNESNMVLEVGCGVGRIAIPVVKFLKRGYYYGIDINSRYIQWCKRNIENRFSNSKFIKIDAYNGRYNPTSFYKSTQVKFPFKNNIFDLVIVHGVFIHMKFDEVEHYLKEIYRILKPGGRCFATYSLYKHNTGSIDIYNTYLKNRHFYTFSNFCTINKNIPETLILHNEDYIRIIYRNIGLCIKEPIIRRININIKDTKYEGILNKKNFSLICDAIVAYKM